MTGKMRAYVGEGEFTDDPLLTFGGYGVVKVPDFRACSSTSARTATSITSPSTRRGPPPPSRRR